MKMYPFQEKKSLKSNKISNLCGKNIFLTFFKINGIIYIENKERGIVQ